MRIPVGPWIAGFLLASVAPPATGQELVLDEALAALGPDARIDDGTDQVQRADFNGDGVPDIAAVVTRARGSGLVVFTSSPRGHQPIPLYTVLPGPVRLRIVPPGRHRVLGPRREVDLDGPALELVFEGKSSAMYVWRNGRYEVHATENY